MNPALLAPILILIMIAGTFILSVSWGVSEHLYNRKRRKKIQKDIEDIVDKLGK